MQDWRHHQILGPNGALAEILGNDNEAVFPAELRDELERLSN